MCSAVIHGVLGCLCRRLEYWRLEPGLQGGQVNVLRATGHWTTAQPLRSDFVFFCSGCLEVESSTCETGLESLILLPPPAKCWIAGVHTESAFSMLGKEAVPTRQAAY